MFWALAGRLALTGAEPPATWGLLRLRSESRLLSDVPIRRVAVRRAAGPVSREAPLARNVLVSGGSAFFLKVRGRGADGIFAGWQFGR